MYQNHMRGNLPKAACGNEAPGPSFNHAELYKPFLTVATGIGLLPFAIRRDIAEAGNSFREQSSSAGPRNPARAAGKSSCVFQLVYFAAWFAVSIGSSGWLAYRLYTADMMRSGMKNLDGLILGMGLLICLGVRVGSAISMKNLSSQYADAMAKFDRKMRRSTLLTRLRSTDFSDVQTIGRTVQFSCVPVAAFFCVGMTVCIIVKSVGTSFFLTGDPAKDITTAFVVVTCYLDPALVVGAYMSQLTMAARFARIKLILLTKYFEESMNVILEETTAGSEEATRNDRGGKTGFQWIGPDGVRRCPSSLARLLAEFRVEYHSMEEEQRTVSEMLRAGGLQATLTVLGMSTFGFYYLWRAAVGLFSFPGDALGWGLLLSTMGLCVIGVFFQWTCSEEGFRLKEQVRKTTQMLRMRQKPGTLSRKEIMMLEQVCQTLTASPLSYNVGQFFTYDRGTFTTMCTAILTQLIVLVQFNDPGSASGETTAASSERFGVTMNATSTPYSTSATTPSTSGG